MKKTWMKTLALTLVLCMAVAVLAACGSGLSGKYSSELGVSLEFKSGDKVVYSVEEIKVGDTVISEAETFEGTYKIDGNKITMDFGDADSDLDGEMSYEQGKDFVKIDGVTFTK